MTTKVHIPVFPLNQFIDFFYYYEGFNPKHNIDRFLPDGEVQLILDLTEDPKYIYHNETLQEIQTCKKAWFSGFRTEPITIPSGRNSEMIIVQFKRGKAYPFINVPMNMLTNSVVDAELVMGKETMELREMIMEAPEPTMKLQLLEKQLYKCYHKSLTVNPFVDFAVKQIATSPNQYSINTIAKKAGYSQKHIIDLFKRQVGVSPKKFLKIVRFQNAINQIDLKINFDWTSIVYECGYYDQSHFISDFKQFSGFTPSAYLLQKSEHLNYIPIK